MGRNIITPLIGQNITRLIGRNIKPSDWSKNHHPIEIPRSPYDAQHRHLFTVFVRFSVVRREQRDHGG